MAYRQYRNKRDRKEVLAKLAKFEIPLDIEAVKAQLTSLHIEFNKRYPTKIVLRLIQHYNGDVLPGPQQHGTGRQVKAPCSAETCKNARKYVEKLMFKGDDEFTTPKLEKIWQQRRQVLDRVLIFFF